jgi:hypothetical protein
LPEACGATHKEISLVHHEIFMAEENALVSLVVNISPPSAAATKVDLLRQRWYRRQ